jgi:molybdenum cofactor guanylyltransferase
VVAGPPAVPEFGAVILAGGRGTRLGEADKPGLSVGGVPMAATVAAAVADAGARQVVLVGPDRPGLAASLGARLPAGLAVTREDPPGAGPVPALRAGLALIATPWVAVLAADLPFLHGAAVAGLVRAATGSDDPAAVTGGAAGAVVADADGAVQWLAGCWRTERLRAALAGYPGASLRGLLGPLRPAVVRGAGRAGGPSPWLDCDTPADLAAARSRLAAGPGGTCDDDAGESEAAPEEAARRLADLAARWPRPAAEPGEQPGGQPAP